MITLLFKITDNVDLVAITKSDIAIVYNTEKFVVLKNRRSGESNVEYDIEEFAIYLSEFV